PSFIDCNAPIIDFRIRKDHRPFGVHSGAAHPTHQVVEVTNLDAFLSLLSRCNDEVTNGEIDSLAEGRRAYDHSRFASCHRMLHSDSYSVRSVPVMRKHPERGTSGRGCVGPQVKLMQAD